MGVPYQEEHSPQTRSTYVLRVVCLAFGTLVILVGAASLVSRIASTTLGSNASFVAFAPLVALNDPLFEKQQMGVIPVASTTEAIIPTELTIPMIGVHASVEEVGQNAVGAVGAPHTFGDVGWYMFGPKPGETGNTIIDGHVNNALTTAGVFENLSQLKVGDQIIISDANGTTLSYSVTNVESYDTSNAPTSTIFATAGPSQVVLITCDGEWVASEHAFSERFVVYATLNK